MVAALPFDVDGTIAETEKGHRAAAGAVCAGRFEHYLRAALAAVPAQLTVRQGETTQTLMLTG